VPEQGQQNNDWQWHTDEPQQCSASETHFSLLAIALSGDERDGLPKRSESERKQICVIPETFARGDSGPHCGVERAAPEGAVRRQTLGFARAVAGVCYMRGKLPIIFRELQIGQLYSDILGLFGHGLEFSCLP
jgi:hypothetical protein